MYFSGLHRAIKDLEEKKFYDIALLFLAAKGYQHLAIVRNYVASAQSQKPAKSRALCI